MLMFDALRIVVLIQVIDPVAPRYTALDKESAVPVFVRGAVEEVKDAQKHPKV